MDARTEYVMNQLLEQNRLLRMQRDQAIRFARSVFEHSCWELSREYGEQPNFMDEEDYDFDFCRDDEGRGGDQDEHIEQDTSPPAASGRPTGAQWRRQSELAAASAYEFMNNCAEQGKKMPSDRRDSNVPWMQQDLFDPSNPYSRADQRRDSEQWWMKQDMFEAGKKHAGRQEQLRRGSNVPWMKQNLFEQSSAPPSDRRGSDAPWMRQNLFEQAKVNPNRRDSQQWWMQQNMFDQPTKKSEGAASRRGSDAPWMRQNLFEKNADKVGSNPNPNRRDSQQWWMQQNMFEAEKVHQERNAEQAAAGGRRGSEQPWMKQDLFSAEPDAGAAQGRRRGRKQR